MPQLDAAELVALIQAETLQAAAAELLPCLRRKLRLDAAAVVIDTGAALEGHLLWEDAALTQMLEDDGSSSAPRGFPFAVDASSSQHQQLVTLESVPGRTISLLLSRAGGKGSYTGDDQIYIDSLQPLLAALVRRVLARIGDGAAPADPAWESLSPAERRVVTHVQKGMTNKDVARLLEISPHTVRTHLEHAYCKLGVTNRTQLASLVGRR